MCFLASHMNMLLPAIFFCLLTWISAEKTVKEVLTVYDGRADDAECPTGEAFECGKVITVNGTVIRYASDEEGSVFITENCPLIINAPEGHVIYYEGVCFYHTHINGSNECTVCTRTQWSILWSATSCSHRIPTLMSHANNAENLTIFTENGKYQRFGFSIKITFRLPPPPTTTTATTSTTPVGVATESASSEEQTSTSGGRQNKHEILFYTLAAFLFYAFIAADNDMR